MNQALGRSFSFKSKSQAITKNNTDQQLAITPKNSVAVRSFLRDLCGVSMVLRMFRTGDYPNFVALHVGSLAQLEDVLTLEQLQFAYEMWNAMVKQVGECFSVREVV